MQKSHHENQNKLTGKNLGQNQSPIFLVQIWKNAQTFEQTNYEKF